MSYNIDYTVVKKPHHDKPLTDEQQDEWLRCALDKYYWMENYVYIQTDNGRELFKPRDYQKRIIETSSVNRFTVNLLGRQSGKQLSLDTVVPTPTGYTTIGEIEVGDVIIGDDGLPTTVVYLSPIREYPDSYSVVFSTGEEILADADHLWEVEYRAGAGKRKSGVFSTKDMVDIGVHVGSPKRSRTTEKRFSIKCMSPFTGIESQLPIDPYILGYWLGDGTTSDGTITIGANEYDDLNEFTEYCNRNNIEFTYKEYNNSSHIYSVRIKGLRKSLRENGILNNKHIPLEYLRCSFDQREKLIQGIMDSDGHISKNGRFEITLKSRKLIDDIHELLSSMGTSISIPKTKQVSLNGKELTYYRIGGSVYKTDYRMFRLGRKYDRMLDSPNKSREKSTKKRKIVSITKSNPVPMRCLQVDNESHLFCVGRSFIPTHNTTTLGVDALHDVIFKKDYHVGITSYRGKNVLDYFQRIKFSYENLPFWMKPATTEYNKSNIAFTNNTSIRGQVTGESTFRGISLNRILVDELAFVKPSISEEFMGSLLPSISAAGENATTRLNIISTPDGTEGVFPSIWFSAIAETNSFIPVEVRYEEIPGRTPEFEEMMINELGRDKFMQEFKNVFISSGGTLVNSRIMESLPTIDPIRQEGDLSIFTDTFKGKTIAIACDIAEGVGEDNHCMQLLDVNTFEQVGELANNMMNQTWYAKQIIKTITMLFQEGAADVYYTIEANGVGAGIATLLQNSNDEFLARATAISEVDASGLSKRLGFQMSNTKKMKGCGKFKDLVETHRIKLNSKKLLTEMKFFTKQGGTFKALSGAKDDRVMGMIIMMLLLEELANYEEEVNTVMNDITEEEELWGISF